MISDLTYKILAYSLSPHFPIDDVVDWAVEMMELGYESDNLYILAGLSKPVHFFETAEYLQATLTDLSFTELSGSEAEISYASYYIRRMATGKDVRQHLKHMIELNIIEDYHNHVYDFYRLNWAWDDFAYEDFSYDWPDANPANIEQIVIDTARKWLTKYEGQLVRFVTPHK